jgi:hypothetical protein
MQEENLIRITTNTPQGLRTESFTPERFATSLVDFYNAHGEHTLRSWLDAHGLTYDGALGLIGDDTMEKLPDGQVAALSAIGRQFAPAPEPKSDVEGAVQGHQTSEMKIEQLARDAESMSTAELEQALVSAGMNMARSSLTR